MPRPDPVAGAAPSRWPLRPGCHPGSPGSPPNVSPPRSDAAAAGPGPAFRPGWIRHGQRFLNKIEDYLKAPEVVLVPSPSSTG